MKNKTKKYGFLDLLFDMAVILLIAGLIFTAVGYLPLALNKLTSLI